jgi:hypothetical protein
MEWTKQKLKELLTSSKQYTADAVLAQGPI